MPLNDTQNQETYKDRIRGLISFTSPDGKEYNAKYISDERTKAKKLQTTDYINVKKTHVRDLGIMSPNEPITFFFDGIDCDLVSQNFWESCDETGQWEIIHPVHGFQSMQLVSVTQKNNYVTGGGVVEFSTEWIEPKNKEAKSSGRQLKSMADYSRKKLDSDSALSFVEKVNAKTESLRKSMENFTTKYTGIINKSLAPIAAISDLAFGSFISAKQMLNDFQFATVGQAMSLAGQFQNMIQTALLSTNDVQKKNRACKKLLDDTIGSIVKTSNGVSKVVLRSDDFGKNESSLVELISVSVLSGICESALTGKIDTAKDGIDIVNNILEKREFVLNNLESIQTAFNIGQSSQSQASLQTVTIDKAYIQNEETIKSIDEYVFNTINYVMFVSSQSKAKKSIILTTPTPSVVFFLKKYKRLTGFEDFCDKNGLSGDEIFFLPSGKEIQI